jgi:hypothetical protein
MSQVSCVEERKHEVSTVFEREGHGSVLRTNATGLTGMTNQTDQSSQTDRHKIQTGSTLKQIFYN